MSARFYARRNHWLTIGLVVACAGSLGQAAQRLSLKELRTEYQRAYEFAEYDRTIELLLELDRRSPDQPLTAFNLASCYAITGKKDEAIKWLRRSGELGFARHRLVASTDNLASIRDEPGYAESIALIAKNRDKAFVAFKNKAPAPDPVVILPATIDPARPAPLIVSMHGYGATAPPVAEVWQGAAAKYGAIVIAPRAPHKVRNAGYQWGEFEEAEFIVLRAIEHATSKYSIDAKRVVLTGFSQGAYMSLALGLRHPQKFCGVIPVCGAYDPVLRESMAPDRMPRFFFIAGDRDSGTQDMKRAAADLKDYGAKVRIVVYENTAHHFPPDSAAATREALSFILGID